MYPASWNEAQRQVALIVPTHAPSRASFLTVFFVFIISDPNVA